MDKAIIEGYKAMRKAMANRYQQRDYTSIFSYDNHSGTITEIIHQNFKEMKIYIINPKTGGLETIEAWKKAEKPASAEWIVIENRNGERFKIHKKDLPDTMPQGSAIAAAKAAGGRLGTRREWLDVWDARFEGLDEAIRIMDGDSFDYKWYWTEEKHQRGAAYGWLFYGTSGYLYSTYYARVVTPYARVFHAF